MAVQKVKLVATCGCGFKAESGSTETSPKMMGASEVIAQAIAHSQVQGHTLSFNGESRIIRGRFEEQ